MKKAIISMACIGASLMADYNIIGSTDRVDIPKFGLSNIKAKIDTGAKSSSLHCSYIKEISGKRVEFVILDESHSKYKGKVHTMPIKKIAKVKSSNGEVEKRYFIQTDLVVYDKHYSTLISLSDREQMRYPMLLGRELLKHNFLVDVNKKDISYMAKKEAQKEHIASKE
jgi:hypothetical protein